jgi:hypothetical protein
MFGNPMGMCMPMAGMGGMGGMMGGMGPMAGMGMNMNMMNMMNMNMNNDEEWMKGFKMAVEEVSGGQSDDLDDGKPKINVIFKTTQGVTHTLVYSYGTTIDAVLKKYLKRVNREDLINDEKNKGKICFLFNAAQLKFGDNTPIEQFFKGISNPKVVVNDVNNLIGA